MKSKLTCYKCKHQWEHERTGSFPCGPCPTSCPECRAYCCPECGGEMGKETGCDDLDSYTAGGCYSCSYECCGGCV